MEFQKRIAWMSEPDATDRLSLNSPSHRMLVGGLIDLRKGMGLSQAWFAALTGLTQSIVAKVEVLERRTEVELVELWCEACDVDPVGFLAEMRRRIQSNQRPPDYWWFTEDGQRRRRSE
jgi:hypothetical protein